VEIEKWRMGEWKREKGKGKRERKEVDSKQ
jgi:hypothetical protein